MKTVTDTNQIYNLLSARFATAFTNGSRWFNQLLDVVRYAVPSMDGLNILYQYNDTGRFLEYYVDNDVPQMAADKRASNLHSLLLPAGRRWGEIYTDGKFNDNLTQQVFEILQKSNIHSIAHSLFLDLTIGCAGIWIESHSAEKPLVFKALTGVAILPEYDDTNNPKNVWFRRAINDIELKAYGRESSTYTSSENMNFVTCGFIHNRNPDGTLLYKIPNSKKHEWLYIEVLNDQWSAPLTLETKRFKNLHLINDTVRAGDARGRGVALKLLNDIVYLNEITKDLKDGIKLKVKPPILANANLGNLNFTNLAGGVLPSTLATDGVPLLQPMSWDFDTKAVWEMRIALENKINEAFNVQPFGEIEKAPVRTATEVAARQADAQRQSITDVSRMVFDFNAIFNTCLDILKARGVLGRGFHNLVFRDPTLDAENQTQLNNLLTYKQMTNELIDPNWSQLVNNSQNIDAYVKEKLNIPSGLDNSPAAIQVGMEKVNEMMQANPKLAQPTTPSAPLDPAQLSQQFTKTGFGI